MVDAATVTAAQHNFAHSLSTVTIPVRFAVWRFFSKIEVRIVQGFDLSGAEFWLLVRTLIVTGSLLPIPFSARMPAVFSEPSNRNRDARHAR